MRLIHHSALLGATLLALPALAACGNAPTSTASAAHPPATTHHGRPVSRQAAINAAITLLAKKTTVPLWIPQATAIHAVILTGHKLSVTATGSANQYQVGLIATVRSYPVNSPHINDSRFGINTVLGDFGGHRYASVTTAQVALRSGSYQAPPPSPPSRLALTARITAEEWTTHGHPAIIQWHQKGWLIQINQRATVKLAREVGQTLADTSLPSSHGVIVVVGATDGAETSVTWRVGTTDYTVSGRPDPVDTVDMADSMHSVSASEASGNTPSTSLSSSWTYIPYTNHGPNGSFTLSIPKQFTAGPRPTDNSGRSWTHGPARIAAQSIINAAHDTLESFEPFNPQTTHVTYRAQGPHWRVESGLHGSTIVYAKVYFLGLDIFWLTITYPRADQQQYGAMVTHVAQSFTPSVKP